MTDTLDHPISALTSEDKEAIGDGRTIAIDSYQNEIRMNEGSRNPALDERNTALRWLILRSEAVLAKLQA